MRLLQPQMQIKSGELLFPFECGKTIHRPIIELKHLTSWKVCVWQFFLILLTYIFLFQMNLGDGPKFIAVEVDLATTNKLKNGLVGKFHLNSDFFKQGAQDPSQRYIIFYLADPIYPRDVANIHEVSASDDFSVVFV